MGSVRSASSANRNWAESTSESGGMQQSGQQATSGQNVWGAQGGALGDLYGQAEALMSGGSPYGQAGAAVGQAGTQAWQGQLTPGSNPYFDQAVQASIDQATDSFKRQVLPELDARSAGAGQLGSSPRSAGHRRGGGPVRPVGGTDRRAAARAAVFGRPEPSHAGDRHDTGHAAKSIRALVGGGIFDRRTHRAQPGTKQRLGRRRKLGQFAVAGRWHWQEP